MLWHSTFEAAHFSTFCNFLSHELGWVLDNGPCLGLWDRGREDIVLKVLHCCLASEVVQDLQMRPRHLFQRSHEVLAVVANPAAAHARVSPFAHVELGHGEMEHVGIAVLVLQSAGESGAGRRSAVGHPVHLGSRGVGPEFWSPVAETVLQSHVLDYGAPLVHRLSIFIVLRSFSRCWSFPGRRFFR